MPSGCPVWSCPSQGCEASALKISLYQSVLLPQAKRAMLSAGDTTADDDNSEECWGLGLWTELISIIIVSYKLGYKYQAVVYYIHMYI